MNRKFSLLLACILSAWNVSAQNVFNSTDSIVRWDPSKPYGSLQNPKTSITGLQKWVSVETNGVSNGYGAFDASSFKAYFLKISNKSVAFRIKYPGSYTNPDSSSKKYPVMIFFHGAGEPACQGNGGIYNNEKHLLHGADFFRSRVDDNSFDGFLVYPQIYTTNMGCWASSWNTEHYFPLIVSFIDSLGKYVRADIDRVVADGLSSGGVAAWKFAEQYPQRVAAIAPTSAVGGSGTDYSKLLHIPVWLATGSIDYNPSLSTAQSAVNALTSRGGTIKHTVYPDQGHFVWNMHWSEPGFFTFLQEAHKANPIIFFQRSEFCPDSLIDARLGISPGFYAYEWQRDSVTIASSENSVKTIHDSATVSSFTGNEIRIRQLASYRVRFKRNSTSYWSAWSTKPAIIKQKAVTQTPSISLSDIQSVVLPSIDGKTAATLKLPEGFTNYQWYKLPDTVLVSTASQYNAPVGQYIARLSESFGCGSNFSPVYRVISADGNNGPDAAKKLTAKALSQTRIQLQWQPADTNLRNETGFEIYKSSNPQGPYTLININSQNVLQYTDSNVKANQVIYYVVRAVNDSAAAELSNQAAAKTHSDLLPPTAPSKLEFGGGTLHSVFIRWRASADNFKVKRYDIWVNGAKLFSSRDTTFTIGGLDSLTYYDIAVQAVDEAENVSPLSNHISAFTHRQGLNYKYYHGIWSALPDFNSLVAVKSGVTDSLGANSGIRTQNDNFGFLWEGFIYIPADDIYTFETNSDDGSKFYIDVPYTNTASAFVNNDGLHAPQNRSASKFFSRGYHRVAITFFERTGGEIIQLFWSRKNGHAREGVPKSYFSLDSFPIPNTFANDDSIAPDPATNLKYDGSTLSSVSLTWNVSASEDFNKYYIYVNGELSDSTSLNSHTVAGLDSLTYYTFAVKVADHARNLSSFTNQVTAFTHRQGINYKYFEGSWSFLPDFAQLLPETNAMTDSVSIGVRERNDDFGFLWEGFLYIPENGNYTFETISDDGSKVYLGPYSHDSLALVDNDGLHGPQSRSASIQLMRGYYPIAFTFFERGGGEVFEVYWSSDKGLQRGKIPKKFFSVSAPSVLIPPNNPDSFYTNPVAFNRVLLNWADNSNNETGFEIVRSKNDTSSFLPVSTTSNDITSFVDSNLLPQTIYHYKVRAIGNTGESEYVRDSATTLQLPISLNPPGNFKVKLYSDTLVELSWDDRSQNEHGFRIWRSLLNDSSSYELIAVIDSTCNIYVDTILTPGSFTYYIASFNNDLLSVASDTPNITIGNTAPVITMSGSNLYLKTDTLFLLNLTVSDQLQDSVSVLLKKHIPFIQLERTAARNYRLRMLPGFDHTGSHVLTVSAKDNKGMSSEKSIGIYVSDKKTRSVLINFGHSSIPAPKPWNNWTGLLQMNSVITNLRDDKNELSPISLKMLQGWQALTGLGFNTGHNSGIFPDTVLERGVRDPSATRQLMISGLNREKRYNIHIAGSVNDGTYAVNFYAAAGKKDTLIIRYNSHESGSLNNLIPDSLGQILVTLSRLPGTPFIYLNGMMIEEFDPLQQLLNPSMLRAEIINMNSVQLTWMDRCGTENQQNGYHLERAMDSNFNQINATFSFPANTTSFKDDDLDPGTKYWYRVRVKSDTTFSQYSKGVNVQTPSSVLYVNFNHNVAAAGLPWNNLAGAPTFKISFPPLLDMDGKNSGVVLKLERTFNGENNAGMSTGNNSGIVPDNVLKSNYWTDKKQLSQVKLSGLNHQKKYSIGFIGSIGPNGWVPNNYTATYTILNKTVYLNSWQNISKIVYITDIAPDDQGEIWINISTTKDAAYGFNSGMIIHEFRISDSLTEPIQAIAATPKVSKISTPVILKPVDTINHKTRFFPNPFKSIVHLSLTGNNETGVVIVDVFDITGKFIKAYKFTISTGKNQFMLDMRNVTEKGMLLLRMKINGKFAGTQKLIRIE